MEIRTIAVIGAGAMGREVAREALAAGYRVILEDVLPDRLAAGRDELHARLDGTAGAALSTAASVDVACREAEMVIDTLPEEVEMKIDVFCILEKFARPGAVLATNARTIAVSEIAAVTTRHELCVGLHFRNGDAGRKLLEVVRGGRTAESTVDACRELGRRMGREVVVKSEAAAGTGT